VNGVRRHVEIPLRRHSSAAPYERARALVGRHAGSVDTLPVTCRVRPLGGATIEVGFSGIRGVYFLGGNICHAILPPWGKIWKLGDSLCKIDASSRAESRHGVRTRLHAGRCGRRAGRPHRDLDSRVYHFAWCHGAAPAERYGGARGDQTDPWNWPEEISAVPRKEWPPGLARLAGDRASCAGPTGGPRIATTGRKPEFALPRSQGSPPGFTALATGPSLNLRPEWLSNPKGTPQRTPGENFGHGTQDARASQMGAFRLGVRNAPGEENNPALREKREPAPARLRFEEDEWGGSPKRQTPAKLEGLSDFPARPQLPQGPPAQMVKEQSSSEVPVESHAGTGGGSASVSLNFPGQASRVKATFNPQAGPIGYPGPAPTGPTQQSWTSGPPTATGPTPSPTNNAEWPQYPQFPVPPAAPPSGYWAAGQGGAHYAGNAQPYGYSYPNAGGGPPAGPPGHLPAYSFAPPPAWFQPAQGTHGPRESFNPSRQSSLGE
jgi:hypothetical protein